MLDYNKDIGFDKLHEECGVFGIFGHKEAAALTAAVDRRGPGRDHP